ncbi:MAG: hypothetical protein HY901_15515 [Deltaproteobacteria bacterium]|nr:hypothetical protein [Deltaproteobacteria bacterium]
MRRLGLLLLAIMGVAAGSTCAPVPKLTPVEGDRSVGAALQIHGVEFRALPNAWRGYPSWLTRRFTPIWVYFINRGSGTFDVTYASMELVDEHGESHPAIPPTLVSREILGGLEQEGAPELRFVQAQAPRSNPEEEESQPPSKPPRIPAPTPMPPASSPPPPLSTSPNPPDTSVYFGLAPYEWAFQQPLVGAGGGDGRGPFGYQPPFSPFGPYGFGRNAADIIQPALREGRLLPNTHAEGFVYFRANHSASRIELRLKARNEAPDGAPLEVRIAFTRY